MNEIIRLKFERSRKPRVLRVRWGGRISLARVSATLCLVSIALALMVFVLCGFGRPPLETLASRGEPEAQYSLGKRYFEYGRSEVRYAAAVVDYDESAKWIRRAAEQGNLKAQSALGLLYANGLGVPQDNVKAVRYFRMAATQGFAVAQNELGVMYAKGWGVPQDLDEAIRWCSRAAEQGSKIAAQNLALITAARWNRLGEVTTRDGTPYKNVRVQRIEADGITVAFEPEQGGVGVAKLKRANLPGQLQQLCGYTAKDRAASLSPFSQLDGISSAL